MADYEINKPYGCVEYASEETGESWMNKVTDTFKKVAWLNPLQESAWNTSQSIGMTKELVSDHMFPMSIQGLERAMKFLN